MKTSVPFVLTLLLLVSSCRDTSPPTAVGPSKEDLVVQNTYTVRDAVEAYYAQNGVYPTMLF